MENRTALALNHDASRFQHAFVKITLCAAAILASGGVALADDIVHVGLGSYLGKAPPGAKTPPSAIFRTDKLSGPMPTNDWWSSLAWEPFSHPMYPHPLAVRAVEDGLRVYYPGANITANDAAIFASMPGGTEDFVIGHSATQKFTDARVDGFSDWFVTAQFVDHEKKMRTAFGHGSPFVFVTLEGGNPTLSFGQEAPTIWAGSATDAVLGITVKKRHYGIFAPTGSTWSDLRAPKWVADTKGREYFAVAVLPDAQLETLDLFRRHAYNHVVDTRVTWSFDEAQSLVTTRFAFTTRAFEGREEGTLTALYPHQWQGATAQFIDKSYGSVRGPMKLVKGSSFVTQARFPGMLPALPLMANADKPELQKLLAQVLADKGRPVADTYWFGKQLGKWATLIPIAEQAGENALVERLTDRLRASLETFLTAVDSHGLPKNKDAGVFAYDANWGTLIGYPASYDSDSQLNDHHFHYGYFIRAAGELARRDPQWASDAHWGGMVKLLIREIAAPDRADKLFPFLRCFDPYAGHTWASGHGMSGDGNNNESSSEAVNAWYGIVLFAEAIGDAALRDLGIWLFTTEIEAINAYWFDVTGKLHHPDFRPSVVTMIWGGKGANGTWFSANPELIHGINWLPFTGASLYLGAYPEYCAKNYAALVEENQRDNEKRSARTGKPPPDRYNAPWDQWADIVWMYRALSDPKDALAQFEARPPSFKPEGGNSLPNVYAWLTAFEALGRIERGISADTIFYAVFRKGEHRTHVAYNMRNQPRTVKFSDGAVLTCAPRAFGIK